MRVSLFTIGFAETSAERFFELLTDAGVKRIIDVRLNNTSQLAGFSKKDDLRFFLKAIGDIGYVHVPELAPTQNILDEYKKKKGAWSDYEREFSSLIKSRRIEHVITKATAHRGCMLCSEKLPDHCHRRLVAEYLERAWGDVQIQHLV